MRNFALFLGNACECCTEEDVNLLNFATGEVEKDVNRSRQERSKYLVAKIGFDTAENEPRRVWIINLSDHICRSSSERLVCMFMIWSNLL